MNLNQIFTKVRLLVHTDLTNQQLCDELNELSKQLFREFPLPDKVYRFVTTEIPYYDYPNDCAEDRIRVVIIDDREYEKLSPEIQFVDRPFCTVIMDKLFINPNETGKDAYLYYRPRHIELTIGNLNAVPNFPEDYHDRLVYGLAQYTAMIQRDVDLVNNFQAKIDEIEKRAKRGLKKMGLRRVKETTRW